MLGIYQFRNGLREDTLYTISTDSSKYYERPQTAVARGLGWPASRLTGLHTASAPKHSLCFPVQFPSNWSRASTYICKAETLAFTDCDYCSAVSAIIVIIAICDMPRQELSLRERVYIHNTYMKSRKLCSETRRKIRINFSRTTCA